MSDQLAIEGNKPNLPKDVDPVNSTVWADLATSGVGGTFSIIMNWRSSPDDSRS